MPSEDWIDTREMERASAAAASDSASTVPSPNPHHFPNPTSCGPSSAAAAAAAASSPCGGAVVEDGEVTEIEGPVSVAAQPSDPSAGLDLQAYASLLKQKLDMYCAAVAMSRSSNADRPKSASIAVTRSLASDLSQHGSQAHMRGSRFKVQHKAGGGSTGVPAFTMMQNSVVQERPVASRSSRDQSYDDELEGEADTTENMDVAHLKCVRRMLSNRESSILSNRESSRRSRMRKQAQLNELVAQVMQVRVENLLLLKRLTDMNQKYNEAAASNRVLKADVETLRARVVHKFALYAGHLLK